MSNKKTQLILLILVMLISSRVFPLNIREITISRISNQVVNIALDTEGEELYYFSSWQYNLSGDTILLEACFMEGFGSTIAFLNNNFEVPLDANESRCYVLMVKVYYSSFLEENMQDYFEFDFSTPFESSLVLCLNSSSTKDESAISFKNPTDGRMYVNSKVDSIEVYDESGKFVGSYKNTASLIDISNIKNGLYFISFMHKGMPQRVKLVVRN